MWSNNKTNNNYVNKFFSISQMNDELKKFIEENYGDVDNWLTTQIEASINTLKK